jgi:hypothetical protein
MYKEVKTGAANLMITSPAAPKKAWCLLSAVRGKTGALSKQI